MEGGAGGEGGGGNEESTGNSSAPGRITEAEQSRNWRVIGQGGAHLIMAPCDASNNIVAHDSVAAATATAGPDTIDVNADDIDNAMATGAGGFVVRVAKAKGGKSGKKRKHMHIHSSQRKAQVEAVRCYMDRLRPAIGAQFLGPSVPWRLSEPVRSALEARGDCSSSSSSSLPSFPSSASEIEGDEVGKSAAKRPRSMDASSGSGSGPGAGSACAHLEEWGLLERNLMTLWLPPPLLPATPTAATPTTAATTVAASTVATAATTAAAAAAAITTTTTPLSSGVVTVELKPKCGLTLSARSMLVEPVLNGSRLTSATLDAHKAGPSAQERSASVSGLTDLGSSGEAHMSGSKNAGFMEGSEVDGQQHGGMETCGGRDAGIKFLLSRFAMKQVEKSQGASMRSFSSVDGAAFSSMDVDGSQWSGGASAEKQRQEAEERPCTWNWSTFDPSDAFSSSLPRITKALKGALASPQNNLRIFVDGEEVCLRSLSAAEQQTAAGTSGSKSLEDLRALISSWCGLSGCDTPRPPIDTTTRTHASATTAFTTETAVEAGEPNESRQLNHSGQSSQSIQSSQSSENQPGLSSKAHRARELDHSWSQFRPGPSSSGEHWLLERVAEILHREGLLDRLLALQKRDIIDVEGAWLLYQSLVRSLGSEDAATAAIDAACTGYDGAASTTVPSFPSCPSSQPSWSSSSSLSPFPGLPADAVAVLAWPAAEAEEENEEGEEGRDSGGHRIVYPTEDMRKDALAFLQRLSVQEILDLLVNWLLSLSASDCSIMLTLAPASLLASTAPARGKEMQDQGQDQDQIHRRADQHSLQSASHSGLLQCTPNNNDHNVGDGNRANSANHVTLTLAYCLGMTDVGPKPASKISSKAKNEAVFCSAAAAGAAAAAQTPAASALS